MASMTTSARGEPGPIMSYFVVPFFLSGGGTTFLSRPRLGG